MQDWGPRQQIESEIGICFWKWLVTKSRIGIWNATLKKRVSARQDSYEPYTPAVSQQKWKLFALPV